jgi:hypothetical protein
MFEKSNSIPAQAIRNRGYTDKTLLYQTRSVRVASVFDAEGYVEKISH